MGGDVLKGITKNKFKKINSKDISILCRQLSLMIKAGVPIVYGIQALSEETSNRNLKAILKENSKNIENGKLLSESFEEKKGVFPNLLIGMIRTGEETGQLEEILQKMSDHYEKEYNISKKIKGSMLYPILLSIVVFLVTIFLIIFVVPNFVDIFEASGTKLPLTTRVLLEISYFLKKYWYLIVTIVILTIIVFNIKYRKRKCKENVQKTIFKIPVLKNHMRNLTSGRLARTLSLLTSSGVDIIKSLEISKEITNNLYIETEIDKGIEKVKNGESLHEAFKDIKDIQGLLKTMIKVGEDSGQLDSILNTAADFFDREVDDSLNNMISLVEPILTLVMGLIVGFIVFSVAMPMFKMFDAVQNI